MSGVAKAVGKVFKKVKETVSDVIETVKENDFLKAVAIAGLVWFAAGTASAYFAAPEAGIGSAMSTSASNMYTTTAQFFGADVAAPGVVDPGVVATPLEGGLSAPQAATPVGAPTLPPSDAFAEGLSHTQGMIDAEATQLAGNAATTNQGVVGSQMAPPGGLSTNLPGGPYGVPGAPDQFIAMENAAAAAEAGSGSGIGAWMKNNPMATMVLGQGMASAFTADEAAEAEKEAWRRKGLMGVDYKGNNYNRPRRPVVSSAMQRQQTPGASDASTPQTVAVPRTQLSTLRRTGQIRRG